jgi:two-component system LytT family response regulator
MPIKFSALIVDDEESARRLLAILLEELQCFGEIRMASSVSSALNEMSRFRPDIIFLDIKMPGKDGFSLIQDLPSENKPAIVIVTAYDNFAIKAIKNQAFDYLLKPVDRKELKQCVQRFIEDRAVEQPEEKTMVKEHGEKISRIRVNTRTGTVFINPVSVLYCKADGNYTKIVTGEKQHLCSLNLGKVEELLSGVGYLRLGRSYIINVEYITMLDKKESTVTMERNGPAVKIQIPRHHLKDLDSI